MNEGTALLVADEAQLIRTNVSAFNGILTAAETDVQKALDKIDDATLTAGGWQDDGTLVRLATLTDNVSIGTAANIAKLGIVGDTNEVQLLVRGNSTQTLFLAAFQSSGSVDRFTITNDGDIVASGTGTITGNFQASSLSAFSGASPTAGFDIALGPEAAKTFGMLRRSTANVAGNTLTIQGCGATSGATNKAGGGITVKTGVSTGNAASPSIGFQFPIPGSSGTSDQVFGETFTIQGMNAYGTRSTADADQFNFFARKSRGTFASPSAISVGDNLFAFAAQAYVGATNGFVSGPVLIFAHDPNTTVTDNALGANGTFWFYVYVASVGPTLITTIDGSLGLTQSTYTNLLHNVSIGGYGVSSDGLYTLAMTNGAAPSVPIADTVLLWALDTAADQSNLYGMNEAGKNEQLTGLKDRVSAQFNKTDTTLAAITGLSINVEAGKRYAFKAVLLYDANAIGGHKYSIAGTATATAVIYHIRSLSDATNVYVITSRQTALGGGGAGQAGSTAGITIIEGLINVNAAGTLTPMFAQNAASGTSSILVGSYFEVIPIGD